MNDSEKKNDLEKDNWDFNDFSHIVKLISNEDDEIIKKHVISHIKNITARLPGYHVIFLYRAIGFIGDQDSDYIYNSLPTDAKKDVLLIIK